MARYHKIVWSEGMFLGPHHFQQWDRHYEGLLNSRLKSIAPLSWGLMDLEINEEGLENGNFMLLSCHGVFPGGSCIDIPGIDEAPPSRAIEEHFDPRSTTLGVYLGIPVDRPGSANFQLEDDGRLSQRRYYRKFVQVVDETTGYDEQEIPIAKKNTRIFFEPESLDGYDYLKIARLERMSNGAIVLDDYYIPPCLSISASPRIIRILRSLVERLIAKSNQFSEQCRQSDLGGELSVGDMLNFQYLQIINSFIPELNHFYRSERGHPEALYRLLARFAGTLTAFSGDTSPTDLPEYYHDDLSGSLGTLDNYIYELLQILVPVTPAPPPSPKYTLIPLSLIPLSGTRESVYQATIQSRLLTSSYRFYVAFRGEGDQIQLIREIPGQVKTASVNEIDLLIGRSLRGINLEYLPSPPSAIPVRPGYSYFALNPRGDYWDDVQQSGSLAIHVPAAFGEVELELMAVEVEEESSPQT